MLAEKRGLTALRYQHWENGKGGEQVQFYFPLQLLFNELADTGIAVLGTSQPASREGVVLPSSLQSSLQWYQ